MLINPKNVGISEIHWQSKGSTYPRIDILLMVLVSGSTTKTVVIGVVCHSRVVPLAHFCGVQGRVVEVSR